MHSGRGKVGGTARVGGKTTASWTSEDLRAAAPLFTWPLQLAGKAGGAAGGGLRKNKQRAPETEDDEEEGEGEEEVGLLPALLAYSAMATPW